MSLMVDNVEEYLLLSGIQHFQFCKRQWALIHIEQQWEENVKTVEGQHVHEKAHQPFIREKRKEKLIVRAMPVVSHQLKLSGECDVVEFIQDEQGVPIFAAEGKYIAYPIEYKRGKPKKSDEDIVQLVAQALCLEEMLCCELHSGFIYYDEIKHRVEVPLTYERKQTVKEIVAEMYSYYVRRHTPKVKAGAHCKSCSLQNICMPHLLQKRSVKSYIDGVIYE